MIYRADIKLMAFIASAMFWGSGFAADNSIYVDQAGDNSTISMTQDGSGNRIKGILLNGNAGGTTDPAKLVGNAQTVTINQVGANNVLALGVNSTQGGTVTGFSNIGVNLNYQVTGGGNTGFININNNGLGTASGDVVRITQDGGASATLNMTGSSNQLTVNTAGGAGNTFTGNINANSTVTTVNQTGGGGNQTTLNMTGDKGQVSVTSVGAANITNVTQSAFGTTGAQVLIDITGSGNTTNVTQSGLFDHYANIKLNPGSNDNNITLAQSGTAVQSASLDLTGSLNNISITQQGAVSNLVNMKVTGSSNTYNILQK